MKNQETFLSAVCVRKKRPSYNRIFVSKKKADKNNNLEIFDFHFVGNFEEREREKEGKKASIKKLCTRTYLIKPSRL